MYGTCLNFTIQSLLGNYLSLDVPIQCTSFYKNEYKKKVFFDLHILLCSCQVWLQPNFENEVEELF